MKKVLLTLVLALNINCASSLNVEFLQRDRIIVSEKRTNEGNKNCLSYYVGYDGLYDKYWVSSCNYIYSYQFVPGTLEVLEVNIFERYNAEDLEVEFR